MKFNKDKCKIHSSILSQEQSDVQIWDVKKKKTCREGSGTTVNHKQNRSQRN